MGVESGCMRGESGRGAEEDVMRKELMKRRRGGLGGCGEGRRNWRRCGEGCI